MEDRYQHTIDGQEVNETDLNLIASEASLADDHVFGELFRLAQVGSAVDRGIVGGDPASAIVTPSGSANATVNIAAFRAFVGAISPADTVAARKNIRSVVCPAQSLQLPAITTNPRWDLIYARVDVDIGGPVVSRFVKTGTTPAAQQGIVTLAQTAVSIGRVQGTESTSPTAPAIPADSGASYYIPLAAVLVPAGFTLTTAVLKSSINEKGPILTLSPGTGGDSLKPAPVNSTVSSGGGFGYTTWAISGRDVAYIPPTMSGKVERIIALHFGSTRTIGLGASSVLDDSIDWRWRLFKSTIFVGGTGYQMPWDPTSGSNIIPDGRAGSTTLYPAMGQSFHTPSGSAGGEVAQINATSASGSIVIGSSVEIYVDMTNGKLMAKVSSVDPSPCNIIAWIEATGQHNNAF